jgi:Large polyvalent protein associated domain 29
MSSVEAAKAIRKELKRVYPDTKFSVTTEAPCVHVRYTNGPASDKVEKLLYRYQWGQFDSQSDGWDVVNREARAQGIPQAQMVLLHREISDEAWASMVDALRVKHRALEHVRHIPYCEMTDALKCDVKSIVWHDTNINTNSVEFKLRDGAYHYAITA